MTQYQYPAWMDTMKTPGATKFSTDADQAVFKAQQCLPPVIGRLVVDRIRELKITVWLGDHQQWEKLIAEVLALPDPEE